MEAVEALQIGFVSRILEDKAKLEAALLETAKNISSKSPVGVYTIKQVLQKAESREYYEGLEYIARTNSAMLQTNDMAIAVSANLGKTQAVFPKLWWVIALKSKFEICMIL